MTLSSCGGEVKVGAGGDDIFNTLCATRWLTIYSTIIYSLQMIDPHLQNVTTKSIHLNIVYILYIYARSNPCGWLYSHPNGRSLEYNWVFKISVSRSSQRIVVILQVAVCVIEFQFFFFNFSYSQKSLVVLDIDTISISDIFVRLL